MLLRVMGAPSEDIRFSTRKTVLYSVLLTVIGLGVIEGLARLTQPGLRDIPRFLVRSIDTDIELPFMEPDPELFWKPIAGFSGPMWGGTVTIGPDSLRETAGASANAASTASRRMLCFGDSITFGFGVSDENSYPAALDALLRPRGIEVRNAGVTGFTSYQTLRWLRRQLKNGRVTDVTLLIGWNDLTKRSITDAESGARLAYSTSSTDEMLRHLAVYRLMKSLWLRRGMGAPDQQSARATVRVPLADYAANLEAFVKEARAVGATPHFISLPSRRLPDTQVVTTVYSETLADVARRLSVPLYDVGVLSGSPKDPAAGRNASYFIDSLHMTAEGNRIMAGQLAAQLDAASR